MSEHATPTDIAALRARLRWLANEPEALAEATGLQVETCRMIANDEFRTLTPEVRAKLAAALMPARRHQR